MFRGLRRGGDGSSGASMDVSSLLLVFFSMGGFFFVSVLSYPDLRSLLSCTRGALGSPEARARPRLIPRLKR